jgi:hypothetical protein
VTEKSSWTGPRRLVTIISRPSRCSRLAVRTMRSRPIESMNVHASRSSTTGAPPLSACAHADAKRSQVASSSSPTTATPVSPPTLTAETLNCSTGMPIRFSEWRARPGLAAKDGERGRRAAMARRSGCSGFGARGRFQACRLRCACSRLWCSMTAIMKRGLCTFGPPSLSGGPDPLTKPGQVKARVARRELQATKRGTGCIVSRRLRNRRGSDSRVRNAHRRREMKNTIAGLRRRRSRPGRANRRQGAAACARTIGRLRGRGPAHSWIVHAGSALAPNSSDNRRSSERGGGPFSSGSTAPRHDIPCKALPRLPRAQLRFVRSAEAR